jgi:hypothetical protein
MQVKRKVGKHEVSVSGTEHQVDTYIAKWLKEIEPNEQTQAITTTCQIIREIAEFLGWDDAKDASIVLLARRIQIIMVEEGEWHRVMPKENNE